LWIEKLDLKSEIINNSAKYMYNQIYKFFYLLNLLNVYWRKSIRERHSLVLKGLYPILIVTYNKIDEL